jgi:hypothetical protein
MKRRVLAIFLFVFLGAIMNIAIAWGLTASANMIAPPGGFEVTTRWPVTVPGNWPRPLAVIWRGGFGWRTSMHIARAYDDNGQVETLYALHTGEVGWPARSMRWRVQHVAIPQGAPAGPYSQVLTGDGLRPEWERLGFDPLSWKRLPTRPIWPGFLINTLFWAVILWLLIPGPFALRRLIRCRRGRCPKCGYDLRGDPSGGGCPECGWGRRGVSSAPGAEDGPAHAR